MATPSQTEKLTKNTRIWALLNVVQSGASTGGKVVWILVILILPLLGFLGWLIFGPRKAG